MDDLAKALEKSRSYSGKGLSVRSLEDTIQKERALQTEQVESLSNFRSQNETLQASLATELERFKSLTSELNRVEAKEASFWSFLPWNRSTTQSRKSIEDLLRRQYETSVLRLREAADFADRLDAARIDLYDELDRLNQKIIDSAQGEENAANYVLELQNLRDDVETRLLDNDLSNADRRILQSQRDKTRRLLAEHTTRFKLYATAEDRLASLRENTRQLAEMIGHLQADITRYVTAASEKLDLVSGQIQAIGAAADAASVMLELRDSLNIMTESMNQATRFVTETQQYFRENVDAMVEELDLYDQETVDKLAFANAQNEALDEIEVDTVLAELDSDELLSEKIAALANTSS